MADEITGEMADETFDEITGERIAKMMRGRNLSKSVKPKTPMNLPVGIVTNPVVEPRRPPGPLKVINGTPAQPSKPIVRVTQSTQPSGNPY